MTSKNSPALVRLCKRMKLLTRLIQAGVVAGVGYAAFTALIDPELAAIWLHEALDLSRAVTLTPATALALATIAALIAGLVLYGLQTGWQLFDRLERADPFSTDVALLLRRAGMIALTGAIAGLALPPVATLLATLANPPGARAISIAIGSNQLMLFLLAGFLFVMGHVMVLATTINEDYERFV